MKKSGMWLNGRQILGWMERHGGLSSVHVRPVPDGWANTLVCHDGAKLTTTKKQDFAVIAAQDEKAPPT